MSKTEVLRSVELCPVHLVSQAAELLDQPVVLLLHGLSLLRTELLLLLTRVAGVGSGGGSGCLLEECNLLRVVKAGEWTSVCS